MRPLNEQDGVRFISLTALFIFVVALWTAVNGCTIPCGHTDPRSCLFYWQYGHWPKGSADAGP